MDAGSAKKEIKFTNAAWTFYNAQTDVVRMESAEVVGAMDVIRQRHAANMKDDAAYRRSYSRLLSRQERAFRQSNGKKEVRP